MSERLPAETTTRVAASDPVLSIEGLSVEFASSDGTTYAVRDVSFALPRRRTLALVGESGSGKSTVGNAILRLIQPPGRISGGRVWLKEPVGAPPVDLAALDDRDPRLYQVRGGRISMIFQEPMTALSPVHTVGNQLLEAIKLHVTTHRREAHRLAVEILGKVGIPEPQARLKQYPFEFSGGMRQRVVIAMALVSRPAVVIADEPTTALDVTVQAQILRLLNELKEELDTSVLFITTTWVWWPRSRTRWRSWSRGGSWSRPRCASCSPTRCIRIRVGCWRRCPMRITNVGLTSFCSPCPRRTTHPLVMGLRPTGDCATSGRTPITLVTIGCFSCGRRVSKNQGRAACRDPDGR